MPSVLAYWAIRGLAQPVRLLLNYVGEEFEDRKYECGDGPNYNRDCWFKEKYSHGLDFPNLPYYIDEKVKLTQSNAILRYIARKYKLDGTSDDQRIRIDLMTEECMDFHNGLVRLCYNQKFDELKEEYLTKLKTKLQNFEKFLGDNSYFVGKDIKFVDFIIYELLDQHKILEPTCLKDFPKLQAFLDRIENLPAIKSYMASDKFMRRPLNNKMAVFK